MKVIKRRRRRRKKEEAKINKIFFCFEILSVRSLVLKLEVFVLICSCFLFSSIAAVVAI